MLRGGDYSGLEWIDGHRQDKPTEAALTAKIAELEVLKQWTSAYRRSETCKDD